MEVPVWMLGLAIIIGLFGFYDNRVKKGWNIWPAFCGGLIRFILACGVYIVLAGILGGLQAATH